MRLKLVTILYAYLQVLFTHGHSKKAFPFRNLFNVSADIAKDYLCTEISLDSKCCTCDPDKYNGNWCVDIFWKDFDFDLATYLDHLKRKFLESLRANNYKTCEPIIHPISSQHIVEKRLVHSSYEERGVLKSCDYEKPTHGRFLVYHYAQGKYYMNKRCADLNNATGKEIEIDMHAECENFTRVVVNTTFQTDNLNHLKKCRFSLHIFRVDRRKLPRCPDQIGSCPLENKNFALCNAYYAPTRGYRNAHCYMCHVKDDPIRHFPIEKCVCRNHGKCYMTRNSILNDTNGFDFEMNDNKLTVTKFDYSFPLASFFDVYKHTINRYDGICRKECCKCDEHCWKYKDCCADKLWNREQPIDMDDYRKTIVEKTKLFKDQVCEKLLPQESNTPHTSYYFMTTTCLPNATQKQHNDCTEKNGNILQTYIPVVGGPDRFLYRNKFCAECNSVTQYDRMNIKIECNARIGCVTRLDTDDGSIARRCDGTMLLNATCPRGHPLQDLCKSIRGPTKYFKNIFCHVCNNPDVQIEDDPIFCPDGKFSLSWSMMLRLDDRGIETVSEIEDLHCSHMEDIFQFLYTGCNTVMCRMKKMPSLAKCSHFINVERPVFDSCMTAINNTLGIYFVIRSKAFGKGEVEQNEDLLHLMRIVDVDAYEMYHDDKYRTVFRLDVNITSVLLNQIEMQIANHASSLLKDDTTSLLILSTLNPVLGTIHNLTFSNNIHGKICHSMEEFVDDVDKFNFTSSCGVTLRGENFNFSDILMQIRIDKDGLKRSLSYCRKYHLIPNCQLDVLKNDIVIQNDGSLIYSDFFEIQTYSVSQYYPLVDGAAVCITVSPEQNRILKQLDVFISIIGTFLSILSYPFIIGTYLIIPRLMNVPGKLIISLCSCLMVGDIMFILAWILHLTKLSQIKQLCSLVGVLMHFGVIMAYTFNVIIGCDFLFRFTNMSSWLAIRTKHSITKIFVFAFFLTSAIVGLAFALDYFDIVSIGYGKNGICLPWINEGRLYFFILPVGISILLSLLLLTRVIYFIKKENNKNKTTLKGSGRRNIDMVALTIKFTVILGAIEGIGLIQVFHTSNHSLFYTIMSLLYTLCRSLRGLTLLVVFVCRKDVARFYNDKLHAILPSRSARTEQETSF